MTYVVQWLDREVEILVVYTDLTYHITLSEPEDSDSQVPYPVGGV